MTHLGPGAQSLTHRMLQLRRMRTFPLQAAKPDMHQQCVPT